MLIVIFYYTIDKNATIKAENTLSESNKFKINGLYVCLAYFFVPSNQA